MLLLLTLLLFAGTVSADFQHNWQVGNEYTYLVRSRTLTSLGDLSDVHTGILIKALLTVQAKDSNVLAAKVWNGQYARVQQSMPDGWETEISDQMLELRDLPISGKPFQIRMKHGLIRDLIVDRDVPTWEVNILKSIVGQLQVDTQGENAVKVNSVQVPTDDEPYASFKAMEDSVGGKCEVLYDIAPLSDFVIHRSPELVPMPTLKGDGRHMEVIKIKNFDNCDQRINYHFGMTDNSRLEPGTNKNGKFFSRSSTSRIVISGSLKHFTIQSSVTTSKMMVSPRLYDRQNGLVLSRMNLTLAKMEKTSKPLPTVNNPESTGNLVYIYNNPFSDVEERRVSKTAMNSNQIVSDNSLSSSEEKLKQDILNLRTDISSSSSSISSSEENDFWQPKPTLEDAPQNSLLPNFVGYKGKHIGKSGKVDVINAAKELIFQIANELEDASNIPVHATLEKFMILCNLMRTMNRKQISELESNMQISPNELKPNDKSQVVKQNTWTVFRDAITQTGTGPAFLTIKEWIERGTTKSMEAANIMSKLPKTVRTPTDSYIRSFFELLQNPKVSNEQFLNTAATLSFCEMIHNAQVNKRSIHNNYPVHTFGRLTSKHDNSLYDEYIPFLERELRKAHQEKDSPRIQTYIMALGMIGEPKILSVFEPYLEGKQQMTVFQRTLMVGSLGKLTETNPKLARSVLYKIYLNTMESHEVRCTAVFLLMKTNPPLSMLQRMAEFTKLDTNRQVNSAVKSTIQSLMKLKSPEWKDLAKKARSVNHLLTHHEYDYELSRGYIDEKILENQNIITHMILNYVGSEDSVIPRILYLTWYSSNGDIKVPSTKVLAMISSVKSFMELSLRSVKDRETIISAAEKIAEELKIVPEELVPLEGNLMINNKYALKFFPFDKHILDKLPTLISNYIEAVKEGKFMNVNMLDTYESVHSFPTETGLPFVYTFNVIKLTKTSGTVQAQINPDFAFIANSNLRLTFSKNVQGRVGFVTPFEHRHFISGIDSNLHVYAPLKISLDVNTPKGNMQWKIWPMKGEEKSRLFHYSVVPFVSNHDILNLRPLSMEKGTRPMIPDDNTSLALPKNEGPFRLNVETAKTNEEMWELIDTEKLTDRLPYPWSMDNERYVKVDMYMNLEGEQKDPVIFSTSFDSKVMTRPDTDSENWTPKMMAVEPTDKQANSKTRRQEMMREAGRGIESAKSYVVDVRVHVPGESESETVLTLAWSESNVENKGRLLGFWRVEMPRSNADYEVCIGSQIMVSPETLLSYDEKMDQKPKMDFNVDIRYGKNCGKGERIDMNGKLRQSPRLKELVGATSIIKDCVEDMKRGNKILRTCQKAVVLSMLLDEVDISMEVPSDALIALYSQGLFSLSEIDNLDVSLDVSNPKNAGKKKIDVRAKLNEYLDKADVIVNTPIMDAHFKDVKLSDFGFSTEDILDTADEDLLINNVFYEDETSCMLDKTRVQTFDGKDYPLRLGPCWHAVMTTYPRINPDNHNEKLHIPKDKSVSVLSRENETGQKEVKVLLGSDKIKFVPGTTSQPEVFVNGEKIVVSRNKAYQKVEENEIIFEIYKMGDRFIGLTSDKFDVSLALDGERVMLKASEDYRYSVRGLCGNFDHDSTNDFVGPKNCLFRKPEHFVASYALISNQCEGDSLNVAKSLQDHDCIRQERTQQRNVISDSESGRLDTEMSTWGYHHNVNKHCMIHRTQVKETDDKICFTMRPVVSCASGCTAVETKSKPYKFHCMEKNEAAMKLKKRIEKGANPDLSQKPVSTTEELTVPLVCKA